MRITCVMGPFLPVPPLMGGAVERIWLSLCVALARQGHETTIISRQFGDLPRDEFMDGVRHLRVLSYDAPRSMVAYRLLDLIYALRVSRMLPPSDITVTNSVSLPLVLPKGRAGKIYVNVGRFPKGQMGFYHRADRLQAVSNAVAKAIVHQSPSVAEKVKMVPNALSEEFIGATKLGRGEREQEVLYVGRIAREKGIDLLIGAFTRVVASRPEWRLRVVGPWKTEQGGDGRDYFSELQLLAASAGDRISFEGPEFDQRKLIDIMRAADIFVYPSVAELGEAFGMSPLEAMACGCAVVVSNLECFRDFIQDRKNGLCFDHQTQGIENLEAALNILMTQTDLKIKLANAGIDTSRLFSPTNIARLLIADFETLLEPASSNLGRGAATKN